jgi:hypothetical protein
MSKAHASAIIRRRDQVTAILGGLDQVEQSATISTMLFGCHSWLEKHASDSTPEVVRRIEEIKTELEGWMRSRGLNFNQ